MRALAVEWVLYDEVVSGTVTTWTKGYPIPSYPYSPISHPLLGVTLQLQSSVSHPDPGLVSHVDSISHLLASGLLCLHFIALQYTVMQRNGEEIVKSNFPLSLRKINFL